MYFDLLKNQDDEERKEGESLPFNSEQVYDMLNLVEAYYMRVIEKLSTEQKKQK